ncbi:rhodanese-like domain-containing protein [Desulfovibrio sp. ZJ200]|uniref:rhodanese-like domain-containing protein n=1 Tax=Desulfovibrio sp. ZJ200 TaxID=2709792 RepID=UPI0013EBAE83|nr:rhodanese-like domain-containing protein [Desulfovibrio sp. ZJ200]
MRASYSWLFAAPLRALAGLAVLLCLLFPATDASARDVSVQEAAALLKSPPAGLMIIDVRTPGEFRQGHLPGAQNMDFFGGRFDLQLEAMPKDRPVLLYCRAGQRSAGAYEAMSKAGAAHILHMSEGIEAWQKAGLPLEK